MVKNSLLHAPNYTSNFADLPKQHFSARSKRKYCKIMSNRTKWMHLKFPVLLSCVWLPAIDGTSQSTQTSKLENRERSDVLSQLHSTRKASRNLKLARFTAEDLLKETSLERWHYCFLSATIAEKGWDSLHDILAFHGLHDIHQVCQDHSNLLILKTQDLCIQKDHNSVLLAE